MNFVRPLVVNLYYKKPVPPVGSYDPKYPELISLKAENKVKHNYKSVFESVQPREGVPLPGDKDLFKHSGYLNASYEVMESEEALQGVKKRRMMPTPAF